MFRITLKMQIFLLTMEFGVLATGSIVRNELHDAQIKKLEVQIRAERNKITVLTQLVSGLKELRK